MRITAKRDTTSEKCLTTFDSTDAARTATSLSADAQDRHSTASREQPTEIQEDRESSREGASDQSCRKRRSSSRSVVRKGVGEAGWPEERAGCRSRSRCARMGKKTSPEGGEEEGEAAVRVVMVSRRS